MLILFFLTISGYCCIPGQGQEEVEKGLSRPTGSKKKNEPEDEEEEEEEEDEDEEEEEEDEE